MSSAAEGDRAARATDDDASREKYQRFAARLVDGGLITDPWIDGVARFEPEPERVTAALAGRLARAAEELAEVYDELCALVSEAPALLEDFFGLTPVQRVLWQASEPLWHGIARADLFVTDEGICAAELNCDTPTGEAEAVELSRLAFESRENSEGALDPNGGLRARFLEMIELLATRLTDEPRVRTVGLVYPTEFTEDLALVRCYRRWLEEAGYRVVLGSPYNLGLDEESRATLFDEPLGVLLRHYKTDWWGERASAWSDEDLSDTLPLADPLRAALTASVERRTAVVNPFGAVLPQNKRAMAFMWEHVHRFSQRSQGLIEKLVPYTTRLEAAHPAQLSAERERWVLKSDYGAEGDEVVLGRLVSQEVWEKSLAQARPGRWIVQRYFEAQTRPSGEVVNYGVYLVGGRASGLYLRAQRGAIDEQARSVGALIVG